MDEAPAKPVGVLTNKEMRSMFFRSFSSMGSFNYKNYNSIGYLYSIIPGLQKIYKDDPKGMQEALARNTEFFNTHPYFKNLVMGVALALEEENAKNPDFDVTVISSTKAALMGPLAGIGDSVFQGTYRVLFSAIGAGFAMDGNLAGPVIYLVPQILLAWGTRWGFLTYAYKYGTDLVVKLRSTNLFQSFVDGAMVVGMMVIAAMTASFVSLKLKLEWVYVAATADIPAKSVTLQGVFDQIFPNLLPVLVVIAMYQITKKVKGGVYWCLGGTFVLAFVGVLIGLF
jgi:mannose/fructose/N-acetylgalactosamine-specific phosphotransferase system component IID